MYMEKKNYLQPQKDAQINEKHVKTLINFLGKSKLFNAIWQNANNLCIVS